MLFLFFPIAGTSAYGKTVRFKHVFHDYDNLLQL